MSFRIEEKIAVTVTQLQASLGDLMSAGACELHPPRLVHSHYFDTYDFRAFSESEEGLLPRRKVRLRYYGAAKIVPDYYSLETKISSVEGRFKTTRRITASRGREKLKIGIFDTALGHISQVLKVSYKRSYLKLGDCRITLDTSICYQRPNMQERFWEPLTVIEVKSNVGSLIDEDVPILAAPRVRFSKFCRGLMQIGISA